MELFTNRDTKFLFTGITVFIVGFLLLSQIGIWVFRDSCIPFISVLSVISGGGIAAVCFWYFYQQHKLIGVAVSAIDKYQKGDTNARIACDEAAEKHTVFQVYFYNTQKIHQFRLFWWIFCDLDKISDYFKCYLCLFFVYQFNDPFEVYCKYSHRSLHLHVNEA